MININLLPPQVKLQIKQSKKSAEVFSLCLVAIIILIVLSFLVKTAQNILVGPNLASVKESIKNETSKMQSFNELENDAVFLSDRSLLAQKIEEKRPMWSQIIQDLINSVPQEIKFDSLNANSSKAPNFILQGTTSSEREIIKFKEKLENSNFFKNVAFKSSTAAENNDATKDTAAKIKFNLEFDLEKFAITSQNSSTNSTNKAVK